MRFTSDKPDPEPSAHEMERQALIVLANTFASRVRARLLAHHELGRKGWDDRQALSDGSLQHMLAANTLQGDMVDVAAIAALIWNRQQVPAPAQTKAGVCRDCGCTHETPCVDGVGQPCYWADDEHTLCTACAEKA